MPTPRSLPLLGAAALLALTPVLLYACGPRVAPARPAPAEAVPAQPGPASTGPGAAPETPAMRDDAMRDDPAAPVTKPDEQWRRELTAEQYRVLRQKGTERAFSGTYWDTKTAGTYRCAGCGAALFVSDAKFDSGCGWPSFFEPLDDARLIQTEDRSHGMLRTEVCCRRCGGHLGHVFDDGPAPTGLRFCINSASIRLEARAPSGSAPAGRAPSAAPDSPAK